MMKLNRGAKRLCAVLIALLLIFCACGASADNATIAVRGRDGFEDYIESMLVWDGRLLLLSYDSIYTWSPENRTLQALSSGGFSALAESLPEALGTSAEELEANNSSLYFASEGLYAVDDKLYRLAQHYGYDEESDTISLDEIYLVEVRIDDAGNATLGEALTLQGDALFEDYGDGEYGLRYLSMGCGMNGVYYGLGYGDVGGRELVSIDVNTGETDCVSFDLDADVRTMTPYDESHVLLVASDYTQDTPTGALYLYELESGEITPLGDLPMEGYYSASGVVYDAARGMLYYALAGSCWRVPLTADGLGEPQEFGDMPLPMYDDSDAVLLGDLYIASGYDGVVGRDVTLDKLPDEKLTVANTRSSEAALKAYFSFTDKHPEYRVAINEGSSSNSDTILQAMMNRSSDVDIYILSSTDSAYQVMKSRGYLTDLSGSEPLRTAVSSMYPFMQSVLCDGDALYAIPLESYGSAFRINEKLLTEKFGYAQEELPQTWPQLLTLLAELSQGKLEEVPEAQLMDVGMTREWVQQQVFSWMFEDFLRWMYVDEANLVRAGDMLVKMCSAYEQIDWEGFGLPEEYEEDMMWGSDGEENTLLQNGSISIHGYDEDSVTRLAVDEGEKPYLGMRVHLAVVNPFSQHREEAIAYLEEMFASVEEYYRMTWDPTRNDPVESRYYEENLTSVKEAIAETQAALDKETDEENRDELTMQLDSLQETLTYFETEVRYEISPEGIARYRDLAQDITIERATMWGEDFYEQISQYMDGMIGAQQLADSMIKTLQMMQLEGN